MQPSPLQKQMPPWQRSTTQPCSSTQQQLQAPHSHLPQLDRRYNTLLRSACIELGQLGWNDLQTLPQKGVEIAHVDVVTQNRACFRVYLDE